MALVEQNFAAHEKRPTSPLLLAHVLTANAVRQEAIAPQRSEGALGKFHDAFARRLEEQEVPLVLALGDEAGLGYGSSDEPSPLLEGTPRGGAVGPGGRAVRGAARVPARQACKAPRVGETALMSCDWNRVALGRTGLRVTPLGLAPSRDLPAREVERAFERGINYLYWGTARRAQFGEGIRRVARRRREDAVIVVQTYTRFAALMRPSLEGALRKLGIDHADLLLLGWWNQPPPARILDAALSLRDRGLARHVMISCHNRPSFASYIDDPSYDAIMVRYNAAHPGAEREVFPLLHEHEGRPGVVSYTATRWGALINPELTPPGEAIPRPSDCYRFVLSNPHVDVCLTGPGDAAQLDESFAALDRGPMSEDEIAWMKRVGAAVREAALARGGVSPVQLLDRAWGWIHRAQVERP